MWLKHLVTAFTQLISFESSSRWSKGGGRLLSRVVLTTAYYFLCTS